jgi:hypothetical protein
MALDLERLRKTAGEVVGSSFFGTLLKMMRNDPFKGKYGHGGRGEEAFAGQLHGVIAERLGTAIQRGPGEAVYQHLAKQQERASRNRRIAWEESG